MQKEAGNVLKHRNLSIEIQRMWQMKCVIYPIDSVQKTVVLGTSHIIRKVLHCET
jgi:hypothetical protein